MPPCRLPAIVAALCGLAAPLGAQDVAPPAAQPAAVVREVLVTGARELPEQEIRSAAGLHVGERLPGTLESVAHDILARYRDAGYSFAKVTPAFDAPTGALTLTIDEGVIDGVEFQGVDERLARSLVDDFALRAGDVFNRSRARQALEALLRPTRGAVRPGRARATGTFTDSRDISRRHGTFDLVDRDGQRILVVGLTEPAGRVRLVPDLGDREDWFTPVDGFVPSLGFGAAVFDHQHFNHAYVAGHVSFRMSTDTVGYALGFERPLFAARRLFVGGELHDLTATDDLWRVSPLEASVDAGAARRSYHDYYRRHGVQINASWRVERRVELLFAWRGERQEPLPTTSDFSVWNRDESFRANLAARDGRLDAIVIGASADGDGFERESLDATYRRHQMDSMFGTRLRERPTGDMRPAWRVDWTSEISSPGALGGDFDFSRHIVTARALVPVSPHQDVTVRGIGGWSGGVLPPQREFAIGGIGSVHGYDFKSEVGDSLALVNLEYALGWRHGFQVLGFFDAGRVTDASGVEAPWLKGVGFGFTAGDSIRIDFGYKLDAVPSSLQVLLRFGRTF